ncbi:MAG: hypothetical protein LBD30_08390 [Verrucomicrobiales bacterium]|jgi:3-oxoacyl-(acyl-carrier-protein) synthase|nr:hypothetical protein [Verrucomicrobiales bacterium]
MSTPLTVNNYKALRLMSRPARQTLDALLQAAADAHLNLATYSPTRAVIVSADGYDPLSAELRAADADLNYPQLRRNTNPLWLLKILPNMPASHFAILTKSGAPSHTVADRAQAAQLARSLISSGEADTVLHADIPTVSATIFSVCSTPSVS